MKLYLQTCKYRAVNFHSIGYTSLICKSNFTPQVYGHLPLIMNDDGSKLSKRQSDIHLQHFRDEGFYPDAIINFVTMSGGAFKNRDLV